MSYSKFTWRLSTSLLVICLGCANPQPNLTTYFDLDQVLNSQVQTIAGQGLKLKKVIRKGGKMEEIVLELDSTTLINEFRLLRDFNPSNPKYAEAFEVTPQKSGIQYTLKENRPGELKFLEITTKGDTAMYKGEFFEEKAIYTQDRRMTLILVNKLVSRISIEMIQVKYPSDSLTLSIVSTVVP